MVTGTGQWLYVVPDGITPETTLCVEQTPTDVRLDIIEIKVNMFNTAEIFALKELWQRPSAWTFYGTGAAC